jgi:carbonic anhydrase
LYYFFISNYFVSILLPTLIFLIYIYIKNVTKKEIGAVLSCIDYRVMDSTIELLKQDCCVDAFDHTVLAGASLGYNQTDYISWKKTFIDHIDLAIQLHHIKKIVVVDHDDCGAYRLFYPHLNDDNKCERKHHIKNIKKFIKHMKKFIKHMKKMYPNMHYSGYLLSLDGSFEKIYQDKHEHEK